VVGNGKPSLNTRVDRLEQRHALGDRWFWFLITGIPTLIAGLATAIANWLRG